jgi:hypothetical protein
VYKDPSGPFSNNLQSKKNFFVSSTSPSGCQAQGVCKYTKLKINMQMQRRQKILCHGNMPTKVICNAMINSKRYDCSVLVCEMQ